MVSSLNLDALKFILFKFWKCCNHSDADISFDTQDVFVLKALTSLQNSLELFSDSISICCNNELWKYLFRFLLYVYILFFCEKYKLRKYIFFGYVISKLPKLLRLFFNFKQSESYHFLFLFSFCVGPPIETKMCSIRGRILLTIDYWKL